MIKIWTKIPFILLLLLGAKINLKAQEESEAPAIKLYGFIRNEFYYDSYKGIDVAMDQFYLLPLYAGQDENGKDINNQGSANFSAIASRIGINVSGPEILGAKSVGNIEVDFYGITKTEPVVLRIRKAFVKLNWKNSSLLTGQTWHPFWGGANYPTIAGFNTGAPFQPFNRSPQLNFDYQMGKIVFSATALYENQYVSRGFYSSANSNQSTLPKRNAAIPELVISGRYTGKKITIGAAVQHNTIQPIDITTGTNGQQYITNEMNNSQAVMAYIQYKSGKLKLLAKTVIGQNLANLCMPGGYGVKSINDNTGAYTYTNYTHCTAFVNGVYGSKNQIGFFAGIGENLGTTDALIDASLTAGLLTKIQNMNRLSFNYAYTIKNIKCMVEYERTTAAYGIGDMDLLNGLYSAQKSVTNNRFMILMMYSF